MGCGCKHTPIATGNVHKDFDSFKVYIVQFEDLLVRTHYSTIQCLKLGFKKDLGIKINEICVVRA
jgi:hypothetical protein